MIQAIARFFNAGGDFMWVILSVMAVAFAIIFERLYFYMVTCRGNSIKIVGKTIKALNENKPDLARKACKGRGPLNALLFTAVERFLAGDKVPEIQEGLEEAAITEMPRMTQRLNYLSLSRTLQRFLV